MPLCIVDLFSRSMLVVVVDDRIYTWDTGVRSGLFVRDVMLLEAPGSPLGRARELQAWKARRTLDSSGQSARD